MNELHAPRWIGLGTLAIVFAVLLGGMASPPAHAADNDRKQAIDHANQVITDVAQNAPGPWCAHAWWVAQPHAPTAAPHRGGPPPTGLRRTPPSAQVDWPSVPSSAATLHVLAQVPSM
jgi:hypothetical protein